MDSQAVLHNNGKYDESDENYTYDYGVEPILKYVERLRDISIRNHNLQPLIVWSPFDTVDSEFVKLISELEGVKVVYSHISTGQDFFEYEPEEWDIIVSNPPFKFKRKFFERALSFNKPFALIGTAAWLNDSSSKTVFTEVGKQLQLLLFDNRMKFSNPQGRDNDKITFSACYYCYDFLPSDLILGGKLNIPPKKRK